MAQLSTELLDKLLPLLEAEYRYNSILCEIYQNENLTQPKPKSPEALILLVGAAKEDALKDKQFLERYLKWFSEELNQQKVLDGLFEECYFALHNLTQRVAQFKINKESAPFINHYAEKEREYLMGVIRLVQPHISNFAKTFREYNPLIYNSESHQSAYKSDLAGYNEKIKKGLDDLMLIYKRESDTLGMQDIRDRLATLSNPLRYIAKVSVSLQESEPLETFQLKLHRETSYFLYSLLRDAQKLQRERVGLIFTPLLPSLNTPSQLTEKTGTSLPKKPEERDVKLGKEHLSKLSSAPKVPTVIPGELEASTDVSKHKVSHNEKELKNSSDQLISRAKTLIAPLPKKDKEDSNFDVKYQKELLFSKGSKKEGPTVQNKGSKKVDSVSTDIPKSLDKRLAKSRYQQPLIDLFYGNLGKVKIEEAVLRKILELAGGKFDGRREAVRRQLSFKGKVGFVPNSESPVVKAHYHTENRRHASPEILAHYRDFFYRIGLTPHQLWPTQHPEVGYQPTRTTRIYGVK